MGQRFGKVYTETEDLMMVQENVARVIDPLLANPLVGAVLLPSTAISTTGTSVAHGLGRKPMGWLLVSPGANAAVWQTAAPDASLLYLQSSADVQAAVLVF